MIWSVQSPGQSLLFREFTGLPELVDGNYLAALAELEKVSGLTLPALEALGQAEK